MTISYKDMRAYAANDLNAAALSRRELTGDIATKQFADAGMEILAMSDEELRRRMHEFGFVVAALAARIARLAQ